MIYREHSRLEYHSPDSPRKSIIQRDIRGSAHVPTRNEIKSFTGSFQTIDSDSCEWCLKNIRATAPRSNNVTARLSITDQPQISPLTRGFSGRFIRVQSSFSRPRANVEINFIPSLNHRSSLIIIINTTDILSAKYHR